jgi:dUTP pyrophosphatase
VGIVVVNLGAEPVTIARGDRIAQLVIAPVARAAFEDAGSLGGTARGAGGFGSTGAR